MKVINWGRRMVSGAWIIFRVWMRTREREMGGEQRGKRERIWISGRRSDSLGGVVLCWATRRTGSCAPATSESGAAFDDCGDGPVRLVVRGHRTGRLLDQTITMW